jgi:formate hydrogenlyase subunit 3/multisubunit Na+/H+ antiporter MnhD subunit
MIWLILTPLAALLFALLAPDMTISVSWFLFGAFIKLDDLSRALLAMTSLLWLSAGIYCYHGMASTLAKHRFIIFWLLTLVGNLGLILAQDIASFYTFFAIMTYAGYGLVVHSGSQDARYAGRIYLIMAVAGEMLILAGFVLLLPTLSDPRMGLVALAIADSTTPLLISLCLLLGFGVKAGLLGVHMWLPLAHPAAPVPASAVLSGTMIKAGLLAWLQMLPLGSEMAEIITLPGLGWFMVCAGLAAAFLAAIVGVMQSGSKAVLAYSSISQMGLMTTLTGLGVLHPSAWPALLPAIVIYMVHHGLAKGSLFLSVGLMKNRGRWSPKVAWLLAAVPAAALVGLPLTSGAAAKYAMKDALYPLNDLAIPMPVLTLVASATAVLMLRFLYLLWHSDRKSDTAQKTMPSVQLGVVLSVISVVAAFWWMPLPQALPSLETSALIDAAWTLLLALALGALAARLVPTWRLPAGDLVWPLHYSAKGYASAYRVIERLVQRGAGSLSSALSQAATHSRYHTTRRLRRLLSEQRLQRYLALLLILLTLAFALLLMLPQML